jgi:hypothetical protein
MMFDLNSNYAVSEMYSLWQGGAADCSTPLAARESTNWAPIFQGYGTSLSGSIGNLYLSRKKSNPNGMTVTEADAVACNGTPATPHDTGYGAIQWGSGELLMEYNQTTKVAYKVIASAGYKGTLDANDNSGNKYSIGIGKITKNGVPYVIDWANPSLRVNELSNAVNQVTETDCVSSGNCTFVADDGAGHSRVAFPQAALYVTLTKSTSQPIEIFTVWTKGQ